MLPPPLGVAALFNASAGWLAATCCGCGFCARCCFDRAFLAWHFARLTSTCASCRHGAAGWVRQGGDNRHKGGRLTEALRFSCSRNIGRCRRRACEVLMPQSREGGRGRVTIRSTPKDRPNALFGVATREEWCRHTEEWVWRAARCPAQREREREGGGWPRRPAGLQVPRHHAARPQHRRPSRGRVGLVRGERVLDLLPPAVG